MNIDNDKIFEISWLDFEGGIDYLFYHPEKDENQFEEDVQYLMKEYGDEYINQEDIFVGKLDWITYVIPKMEEELGYQKIKSDGGKIQFFGGEILEEGEGEITEERIQEFREFIGERLFQKACEKNKNNLD